METIIGIGGATTLATALVLIFKFAWPSAPSKAIAGFAFLAGQISSGLVQMAGEGIQANQKIIAVMVSMGILATISAMGLRAGENAAEARRTGPEVQADRAKEALVK